MKRLLAAVLALAATPALAHHPLAGAPMETTLHGVLSGIGHPVLGFDHLAFVIAAGLLAAFTGYRLLAPLGYVLGMIAGTALMVGGVAMPMAEPMIALSLLIVGVLVASGRSLGTAPVVALIGVLGLFHGSAFGQSIAGQEGSLAVGVVAGYFAGLALVQWAIAVAAGWVALSVWNASAESIAPRLAGAAIAGIGGFLVLETAEAATFAALGLG